MKHHWDISQCQVFYETSLGYQSMSDFLSFDERYYTMLLTNGKNFDKYNIIIDYDCNITKRKEKVDDSALMLPTGGALLNL